VATEAVSLKHPSIGALEIQGSPLRHELVAQAELDPICKWNGAERSSPGRMGEFRERSDQGDVSRCRRRL
jgi:hypothetical protein